MGAFAFDDPQKLDAAFKRFVSSLPPALRPAAGDEAAHRNAFAKALGARNWEDGLNRARQRQREASRPVRAGAWHPGRHYADLVALNEAIPFGEDTVPFEMDDQEFREQAIDCLVRLIVLLADAQESGIGRRPVSGQLGIFSTSGEARQTHVVSQLSDPLGQALRRQIRAIGQLLHDRDPGMPDTDILIEVRQRCERLGIRQPDPVSVLDRSFDGIGGWLS